MKNLFLLLFLWPIELISQIPIGSTPKEITVFESGAFVQRELILDLKKGDNQFIVKGISPDIDKSSIQFKSFDNQALIVDFNHQASVFLDGSKAINKKIEDIELQKRKIEIEKTLLAYEEKLLLNNQTVGGTYSGMKQEELVKTVDYFDARMKKILLNQFLLKEKVDSLDKIKKSFLGEIQSIQQNSDTKLSEVIFTVRSEAQLSRVVVHLTYFVNNAGWKPSYSFIVSDLASPLKTVFNSKVFQYTGENWSNVQLTLSNSLPKKNAEAPILKPWYWGSPNDYSYYFNHQLSSSRNNEFWGTVYDNNNEPLPGANITLKGTSLGCSSDANGVYRLTIPADRINKPNTLVFSSVGYETDEISPTSSPTDMVLTESANQLQEVVVQGYATKKSKSMTGAAVTIHGRASGVSISRDQEKSLIVEKELPTSIDFTFQEKVSLPSDGKDKFFQIKEVQIPASFEYVSSPKIEPSAFLNATITDWEKYNFQAGEAKLYFEGNLVGNISLTLPTSDSLVVSLGRDPSIKIDRKLLKTFSKKVIFSNDKIEELTYEITVKNTKNRDIALNIFDQFPLASNKDIEVYAKKAPEGQIENETGKITFATKLKALETKKLTVSYMVKYPKNANLER